jgi:hypothetical protein
MDDEQSKLDELKECLDSNEYNICLYNNRGEYIGNIEDKIQSAIDEILQQKEEEIKKLKEQKPKIDDETLRVIKNVIKYRNKDKELISDIIIKYKDSNNKQLYLLDFDYFIESLAKQLGII